MPLQATADPGFCDNMTVWTVIDELRCCCSVLQEQVNLADLLAFADAVGSSRGVMKACMHSMAGSLTITVSLKHYQQQHARQQQAALALLQQQQQEQLHLQAPQHNEWENDSDEGAQFIMQEEDDANGLLGLMLDGENADAAAAAAAAQLQAAGLQPPPAAALAPERLTFDVDSGRAYYWQDDQLRSDNISSVICIAEMDRDQFREAGRQLAQQLEVLLYQAYNLQVRHVVWGLVEQQFMHVVVCLAAAHVIVWWA
jgi:hypothetical protein